MKYFSVLLLACLFYSFNLPSSSVTPTFNNHMTLQDTVPMLLKVSDTIIVFDYDTYEETIKIVESEIFNPNYFLQEKYMRDTIQSIDTIMTFDPNTEREIREIYEVKTPKGIQMLLDYEYGKEVPDFDNLQKYLDMCKKKKIR